MRRLQSSVALDLDSGCGSCGAVSRLAGQQGPSATKLCNVAFFEFFGLFKLPPTMDTSGRRRMLNRNRARWADHFGACEADLCLRVYWI